MFPPRCPCVCCEQCSRNLAPGHSDRPATLPATATTDNWDRWPTSTIHRGPPGASAKPFSLTESIAGCGCPIAPPQHHRIHHFGSLDQGGQLPGVAADPREVERRRLAEWPQLCPDPAQWQCALRRLAQRAVRRRALQSEWRLLPRLHRQRSRALQAVVPLGKWSHVAGVFDAATKKLQVFVDGTPDTSVIARSSNVSGNRRTPLDRGVGFWREQPLVFAGAIDEARVWKRALSPEEVSSSAQAGMRGLWHFNGNGADSSGYGNDVTAMNGASFTASAEYGSNALGLDGGR